MADLTGIVKGFLLNAPPGEFLEVVSGTCRWWAVLETDARPDSGVVLGLVHVSWKVNDGLKCIERESTNILLVCDCRCPYFAQE